MSRLRTGGTASGAAAPERAAELDADDPLGRFVDDFADAEPGSIYLDGNSLGRPPKATLGRIERFLRREWAGELVRAWDHWLDLPSGVGDRIGASVLGAGAGEVIVADSTTVNLYRLAVAALDARPGRKSVVVAGDEFPTDRYVLEGLAASRGLELRWIGGDPVNGVSPADIAERLDTHASLVVLSHVNYRTAAIADMAEITRLTHEAGALVLWDLSHAAGALRIELSATGVDLAVGCTYKYLNGGPGSPAFFFVRSELQDDLRSPIQGWFGQHDQFAMGPRYQRRAGIGGWLAGTPTVTALLAIDEGIAMIERAGIDAIRSKGIALTEYAIGLHDAWLAPLGFRLGSPRDASRRGSHVSVRRADAHLLTEALLANGVVPDFREPDSIRIGLSPLSTRFVDVFEGIRRLRDLAANR